MENQKKRHCLMTAEIEIDEEALKNDQAMADFLDQHGITGLIACTPYEASTYQEFATYKETLQAHKEHLQKVNEHFSDMELSSRNLELALMANGYNLSQLLKGTGWTEKEIRQWFPSITEKTRWIHNDTSALCLISPTPEEEGEVNKQADACTK